MNIVAIIPVKGRSTKIKNNLLLKNSIRFVKNSKFINKVIVSSDDPATIKIAEKGRGFLPF